MFSKVRYAHNVCIESNSPIKVEVGVNGRVVSASFKHGRWDFLCEADCWEESYSKDGLDMVTHYRDPTGSADKMLTDALEQLDD